MKQNKTAVVKVGGSLLALPDLPDRIARLKATIAAETVIFVAGGGAVVDGIRRWDSAHGLDPEFCHELAIDALAFSARLLVNILPGAALCSELPETGPVPDGAVLDVPLILTRFHARGEIPLPAGWHVTSDSIAAWIAIHWPAGELILAKSTEDTGSPPEGGDAGGGVGADGSRADFVDPWLQHLVPQLPLVSWCNLRSNPGNKSVLSVPSQQESSS